MATVVLGGVPTTIDMAEAVTNWTGDTFSLEPDIKVQGSNSVATVITPNAGNNQKIWVAGTWDFSGGGEGEQHIRLWANISFGGNLQTEANDGWAIYLSDGTNESRWTVAGSDTYAGGWVQFVIYTGDTPDNTSGTLDKSAITQIGFHFEALTKPRNVPANAWFDAWRYGDGYYATGGTSGDGIDLDLIAVDDLTNAYGIVTKEKNGSISLRGDFQVGNGSTTTWFKMDNQEAFFVEEKVNAGLYKFHGNGAGCRIDIVDATIKSAGTAAKDKFDFDMSETNLLVCSVVDTKLTNADQITYKLGQTATGNIYNNCGQIIHAGADKDDCTVKNYEGTVNTSALIYNVNADPDGEMDDMTFIKGTVATHAIEFGLLSPLTMTLRDVTCSDYNVSDSQNDSTFHFKRTSGTITLNLVGFTGNASYRTDGATVVIVAGAVALNITAKDALTKAVIEGLAVTAEAGATGPLPYKASVTITRSGSVATVAHTAHGLSTNQKVKIEGAVQNEYNRIKQITWIDANSYSFVVVGTPTTPATGTILATAVIIDELTPAGGVVTDSRVYSANQSVVGNAAKGSAEPVYVRQGISTTIDKDAGTSVEILFNAD